MPPPRPYIEPLEHRQLLAGSLAHELLNDPHDGIILPINQPAGPVMVESQPPAIAIAPVPQKKAKKQKASPKLPTSFHGATAAPVARFEGYFPTVKGKIYAMGGFDSNFQPVPGIDVYNPSTDRWTRLTDARIKAAETHAGVAVDGKYVYFAGGYVGALEPGRAQPVSKNVWRFDPASDKWKKLTPLPTGRGAGTMIRLGRELHFFGGCGVDRVTNYGDHWVLPLGKTSSAKDDGKTWTRKASLPGARDHLASVAIGDELYAVGGEFGHDVRHQQSNLFQRYDPRTNKWTTLARLPVARSHNEFGVFAMGTTSIVVAGGQGADYLPTTAVLQYNISTNTWSTRTPLPAARQGLLVHPIGNKVVVGLGGTYTDHPQKSVWTGLLG